MKEKTTRNKLQKVYNTSLVDQNQISKKTNPKKVLGFPFRTSHIPPIIYDSDWIDPGVLQEDGITILGTQEAYFRYAYSTAKLNQREPFSLFYNYAIELNISETLLPHVKASVLVENYPETQFEGVGVFGKYVYDDNYYGLYGDSTRLYQGKHPEATQFLETDDINTSCCGKWYYGTINYSRDGDTWEMRNSYVVSVITVWDKVAVPIEDGPTIYSYKQFELLAIDNISSSNVTGTGTYTVVTASEPEPGVPHVESVVTKNVTMTAPLFDDSSTIELEGNLYKNGSYETTYSISSPLEIIFQTGYSTLNSFSYTWTSESGISTYRLFYSNKRAKPIIFNASTSFREFTNLPTTDDYQTATLPYTTLTVKENYDNYPEIEIYSFAGGLLYKYTYSYDQKAWSRTATNNYIFHIQGELILSALSSREGSTKVDYVNEIYSHSGDTFVRNEYNRDPKDMPIYYPEAHPRFRLIVSFDNPNTVNVNRDYNK